MLQILLRQIDLLSCHKFRVRFKLGHENNHKDCQEEQPRLNKERQCQRPELRPAGRAFG